MLLQEELFDSSELYVERENIKAKDYVYVKKNPIKDSKVVSIQLFQQGYVTKVELIDGDRICSVFFGRKLEKYYDYQLTKRLP
ncbi:MULTISPECIES: hypothetical protein [Cytobacillus]|uniref:Uncharacterized protein n=1 Tax=Cytobacillus horneckiae TaxID=549687 RepID=A0A2N0ZIG9_9BACI|nr:hypothetical protein [Cytobacillus horneckiae]MEC1157730.1 hypothetical protein [Cytobacillus horneckiae]PKG29286.1 hypothetical protein CWS20_09330 [Cytobacillus horneckiae]SGI89874.1 Uncharacterised protein [Mycobacterium tuberculosis]